MTKSAKRCNIQTQVYLNNIVVPYGNVDGVLLQHTRLTMYYLLIYNIIIVIQQFSHGLCTHCIGNNMN